MLMPGLREWSLAWAVGGIAAYVLAWVTRPAGDAAVRLYRFVVTPAAIAVLAAGIATALTLGIPRGSLIIVCAYFIARGFKAWYESRVGGMTAGGLALATLLFAGASVVVLAWLPESMLK